MNNCMLDLETMGLGPNAAIIAIGAVMFDFETQQLGPAFYRVVDLASSVKFGGVMDAGTVLWWMTQSDEARADLCQPGVDICGALHDFSNWLGLFDDVCMWGNGAAADNVWLRTAYERAGIAAPWKFYNDRCFRTLRALRPDMEIERVGVYHNALDDAKTQALHAIKIGR